ncbi:GroES-like protein [Choiromyces venosus 120613-1]|uniref:GroES-like protein n=1 Tax=Choiromyces venosus 120613-1 TaxID=1336337 RepID=A0A3N4JBA1_9PEZI|nr:GroES-like protein [Choiromyces venosus 120613-1]
MLVVHETFQVHQNVLGKATGSRESLANLVLKTVPKPKLPGEPGYVLAQFFAAALNYRDLLIASWNPSYPTESKPGFVPLSDAAGQVTASISSKWKPGDRVILLPNISWQQGFEQRDMRMDGSLGNGNHGGGLTQYAVVKGGNIFRAPANLVWEEAAALETAGGIAMNTLFYGLLAVQAGDVVLTQGTGGVSTMAIQVCLAKLVECSKIVSHAN